MRILWIRFVNSRWFLELLRKCNCAEVKGMTGPPNRSYKS